MIEKLYRKGREGKWRSNKVSTPVRCIYSEAYSMKNIQIIMDAVWASSKAYIKYIPHYSLSSSF